MLDLYRRFHALRRPPGETRSRWEEQVEQARHAALAGEIDGPAAVFEQAQGYGSTRAAVLRFQLRAMQGDWYRVTLTDLFSTAELADDPIFLAELTPLLWAEEWLTPGRSTLDIRGEHPLNNAVIDRHRTRLAEPGFRLPFGNPEFDALIRGILADLPAPRSGGTRISVSVVYVGDGPPVEPLDPPAAEDARRAAFDAAWPRLVAAMSAWRPVSDLHIAPMVLFTCRRLTELITPSRGRELLSIPRGGNPDP